MKNKRLNDAFFSAIAQLWRFLAGPVTMFLLPLYVSNEEQGIWYTFIGLAALSTFADMGFTNIIMQFSAHEVSKLTFLSSKKLEGDALAISRMASLYKFVHNWALKVGGTAFGIMFLIGLILFKSKISNDNWVVPWVLFTLASFIMYVNNTILVFIEGCNQVADVQKLRLAHGVVNTFLFWIALVAKTSVWGLTGSMLLASIFLLVLYMYKYRSLFFQLREVEIVDISDLRKKFYSLFWKYAASFSSGYFIFQVYTPLVFANYGADIAGKVGLTLNMWMAAFNLSNVWIQSSYPQFNIYIAKKQWMSLEKRFISSLKLTIITFVTGVLAFILFYKYFGHLKIFDRMLPIDAQLFLILGWFVALLTNSYAVYVRSHKIEPFALPSFVQAVISITITLYTVKFLDYSYLFVGFMVSFIITFPWTLKIFFSSKKLHFKKEEACC